MDQIKIVQMLITPNDNNYQGSLLGLGSNGVIYRASNTDNEWLVYMPCEFKKDADFLCSALQEIINRIELCGASPDLTRAVSLASDLLMAISDHPGATFAAERVKKELANEVPYYNRSAKE